jgi:hypothetical protein
MIQLLPVHDSIVTVAVSMCLGTTSFCNTQLCKAIETVRERGHLRGSAAAHSKAANDDLMSGKRKLCDQLQNHATAER